MIGPEKLTNEHPLSYLHFFLSKQFYSYIKRCYIFQMSLQSGDPDYIYFVFEMLVVLEDLLHIVLFGLMEIGSRLKEQK